MYYYIQCGSTSKDAVILHHHVSTVAHTAYSKHLCLEYAFLLLKPPKSYTLDL